MLPDAVTVLNDNGRPSAPALPVAAQPLGVARSVAPPLGARTIRSESRAWSARRPRGSGPRPALRPPWGAREASTPALLSEPNGRQWAPDEHRRHQTQRFEGGLVIANGGHT